MFKFPPYVLDNREENKEWRKSKVLGRFWEGATILVSLVEWMCYAHAHRERLVRVFQMWLDKKEKDGLVKLTFVNKHFVKIFLKK